MTAQLAAHPAFPLVTALWFAALIGVGSLLVPTALVERVVVALGLPSVISAAAPPLGMTAKIAIAVLGALAGAVFGLLLGRQIFRAGRGSEHSVAPINAHEELGAEGLDGAVDVAEEAVPVDLAAEAEETAEASLEDDEEADDAAWDLAWLDHEELDDEHPTDAAEDVVEPEVEAEPEPEPEPELVAEEVLHEAPTPAPVAFAADLPLRERTDPNPELDDLSLPQLARRLQSAIGARRAMQAAPAIAAVPVEEPEEPEQGADQALPDDQVEQPREEDAPVETPPAPQSPPPEPDTSAVHHPAAKPFLETDELVADDADIEDETALDETYSSLLAMTASVRAQPEEPREEPLETAEASVAEPEVAKHHEAAPASTLAALDRVGQAEAPARAKVDPQEQALRDALMNLHHFTQNS